MATAIQHIEGAAFRQPLMTPEIKLEIFASVPGWAIVHAAQDDRSAPLIREGEVAVVEADGFGGVIPEDGGLYLIEYVSPPHCRPPYGRERRTRQIVQTVKGRHGGWWARPYVQQTPGGGIIVCSDGPYRDEIAMAEKILGRVVGIYRPRHMVGAA